MVRLLCSLLIVSMGFWCAGCTDNAGDVEFISIDFPHGETRLHVWKDGRAALFYGARPQHDTIKVGTFSVGSLYEQIRPRLHPNVPKEEWPNPSATAGMVQIRYRGRGDTSYLIFDEYEFSDNLFKKARINVVGKKPL